MCVYVCLSVCVCLAVNSPACYIWIVNDITDFNTCLFSVSGFCLLFYFGIVCVRWCVRDYVCVCLHDYIVTKYFNSC